MKDILYECRKRLHIACEHSRIPTYFLQDGRVSGVTYQTRLIGSSYLYPHVTPDPHTTSVNLHHDDQVIVVANQGLWKYMSYQDVINEVIDIPDPVIAAKRLQDLAQGFGSKESIGVLVIRLLLSDAERENMRRILQTQYNDEQRLLEVRTFLFVHYCKHLILAWPYFRETNICNIFLRFHFRNLSSLVL